MAQTSRIPVLLTVPLSVMRLAASIAPPYWLSERPLKVLLPSAGLEVLNNAIAFSPCRLFRLSQRQGITAGPPAGSGPKAESNINCSLDGTTKAYCTPEAYHGATCWLFRNRGNGTFEDVTAKSGIFDTSSKSLGVAMLDYDNDGWPDLFVANDT